MSSNVLADAARRSFRLLLAQAGYVAAGAVLAAVMSGSKEAWSVVVGGGIGLIWPVYMSLTLFRHSLNHGQRMSAMTFVAGWLIKVALTVALLVLVFRSKAFAPPFVLSGLAGSLIAYWFWLTFKSQEDFKSRED